MRKDEASRFWDKVEILNDDDCWEWKAGRLAGGYGAFRRTNGQKVVSHRLAWIMCRGVIPEGIKVLHRCDNPPCCNPAHLFLGTQQDNIADMVAKRRQATSEKVYVALKATKHLGNHPGFKLSDDDIISIRCRYAAGAYQNRLAAEFGVSQPAISSIVRGDTASHLGGPVVRSLRGACRWRHKNL